MTIRPHSTFGRTLTSTPPFAWIRQKRSATVGKIGAHIVRLWAEDVGLTTAPRLNSDHDLRINGVKIEVKTSTLWSGKYLKFQQIRDQDYQYVCMLGLEPKRARIWVVPKDIALRPHASRPEITPQHGGGRGKDTIWISFRADSAPDWLTEYGGDLATAQSLLEQAGKRRR